MIQITEELGHTMVVDEANLNFHTQSGWTLKAIVEEELHAPIPISTPAHQDPTGRYIPMETRTEYHNIKVVKYVVSRSKDDTIKELSDKLHTANQLVANREDAIRKLKSDLEASKKLQDALDQANKKAEATEKALREAAAGQVRLRDQLSQVTAQFQILSEANRAVEQLQKLEDWTNRLLNMIESGGMAAIDSWRDTLKVIGDPELTSRKTWAERLLSDDSL